MVGYLMRYILGLLLILSPFFVSQSRGDANDIAAATRSVVRIAVFSSADGQRTLIGHGSGVAVGPDKIITNAHVAGTHFFFAQYGKLNSYMVEYFYKSSC